MDEGKFWRKHREFKHEIFFILLFLVLILFFLSTLVSNQPATVYYASNNSQNKTQEIISNKSKTTLIKENISSMISSQEIKAKTIAIYDRKSREFIFKTYADEPKPLASLVKIVSAWFLLEKNNHNQEILITKKALRNPGDNSLIQDAFYNFYDLLNLMLISSSNDASFALFENYENKKNNNDESDSNFPSAETLKEVESFALEKGLTSLSLNSISGLDVEDSSSAEAIPKEFILFVDQFIRENPNQAKLTNSIEIEIEGSNKKIVWNENTNKSIVNYPDVEFSKTGFTKEAGGNIIWQVKTDNFDYLVLIMGSGFSERFTDFIIINDMLLKNT